MKNKAINKVCSFALALMMALTILPTTTFALDADGANGGESGNQNTETRTVKVSIPTDKLQVASDSGDLEQTLSTDSEFKTIVIEAKDGYTFAEDTTSTLNNGVLKDTNLTAKISYNDDLQSLRIQVADGKSSSDVQSVAVTSDDIKVINSYVLWGGTSTVGATDDTNKMNAKYDVASGVLTFDCSTTGTVEFHSSDSTVGKKYYNYLTGADFTRFYIRVWDITDGNKNNIGEFNLGDGSGSTAPNTKYASSTTTNPYINLKTFMNDVIQEEKVSSDWNKIAIDVIPCSANGGAIAQSTVYFTIEVGKQTIYAPTISVELPTGLKKAVGSGDLTQVLTEGTTFTSIILEPESGYTIDKTETSANLEKTLEGKNFSVGITDYHQRLTISAHSSATTFTDTTINASNFVMKQTYIMYSDDSIVGKTGDDNKMNAQYNASSGRLTFNCDRTEYLEYYQTATDRHDYSGFKNFKIKVYEGDENGANLRLLCAEFNLGDDTSSEYASSKTVNPYINLRKLVNDKGLKDETTVWVEVIACNSNGPISEKYIKFMINAGTVSEIKKVPSSDDSSSNTKKSSGGWDDGGPFTTDTCGNVFDRWGNKIYEAKGCNVGGYNLVRTSVED